MNKNPDKKGAEKERHGRIMLKGEPTGKSHPDFDLRLSKKRVQRGTTRQKSRGGTFVPATYKPEARPSPLTVGETDQGWSEKKANWNIPNRKNWG